MARTNTRHLTSASATAADASAAGADAGIADAHVDVSQPRLHLISADRSQFDASAVRALLLKNGTIAGTLPKPQPGSTPRFDLQPYSLSPEQPAAPNSTTPLAQGKLDKRMATSTPAFPDDLALDARNKKTSGYNSLPPSAISHRRKRRPAAAVTTTPMALAVAAASTRASSRLPPHAANAGA